MPVVDREDLKTKIKNVAKKSTTKKPQLWNSITEELKERDITTVSIAVMDSTKAANVFEKTLDNLKALNGASVKENGDNCDTELKILSTESVQDNGLLDKIPTEDAIEHVSTDEEDNLLNLSDTESQDTNTHKHNEQINIDKITDSPSHPLAIGVQVRNSVRDIMSKLVQDGSPEVNKILAKPKGDDSSRANSPKTIKANTENKSEIKPSGKMIKENLFEIMSAESESDDMMLNSSCNKSNIVSIEMGEDINISSVSMGTTPQVKSNTQDNTISSLFSSDQNSVSNSVLDSSSADNSNIFSDVVDNSVSAANSISSVDFSDKVSDILVSDCEENSKLNMIQKLKSGQDKVLDSEAKDNSNMAVNSNLGHSKLFSNFENPLKFLDKSIDDLNDVENSEKLKNSKVDNLTVDMESSGNSDIIDLCKASEIPPKTPQPYDDISDSNDSVNVKPDSLQLDSKQSTYSDDDILDLNENLNSPKPEKTLDTKVGGNVTNETDKPHIFSDGQIEFKSFDDNEDSMKLEAIRSVNPFQFSVDEDDNSNSNLFGKINIDEICDHLLIDEPKPDVSVRNKVEDESKVVDKIAGNESKVVEKCDLESKMVESSENASKMVDEKDNNECEMVESSEKASKMVDETDNECEMVESSENASKMVDETDNNECEMVESSEKASKMVDEKDNNECEMVESSEKASKMVDETDGNESKMVENSQKPSKVMDVCKDNESNISGESLDVRLEEDKESPKDVEESCKEINSNGDGKRSLNNAEVVKTEDSKSDDVMFPKSEGTDINRTSKDQTETKSEVVSMDISNISEVKPEIKNDVEMKKEEKIDFKIDQEMKDDKCGIKIDPDKKNEMKDEKVECMDIDEDNTTISDKLDDKSVSKPDSNLSGTKSEENAETKPESVSERKRSGESPNLESQAPPKRSRLDIMIGKLGSQIGIAPESVPDPIDCDTLSDSETESKEGSEDAKSEDEETKSTIEDDDVKTIYEEVKKKESTEDAKDGASSTIKEKESSTKISINEKVQQEAEKEIVEDHKNEESKPKKTESVKVQEEVNFSATTISDDDDDDVKVIEEPMKSSETIQPLKNQDISYGSEVNLDQVIRKRVLQLIKSYRDETIAALQVKVNHLTKSTEQWKNTSKELQKQVVDLTIVQQRLDKRKAATAALKSITSRSIGCQVDTTKLQNGNDMMKSPPKPSSVKYTTYTNAPPNASQNMVSMIKQPTRSTSTITTPVVNNMSQLLSATAESRNTNINNVRQGTGVSSVRNLLETTGRAISTQNSVSTSTSSAKNVSYSGKVIDLTADEENTKKLSNSQVKAPIMVPLSSGQLIQNVPGGLPPGASILLSGPSGTQIVNQSQLNKMGGALQVVTVSSGSQIRPGQFLTVIPSTASTGSNIRPQPVTMTTTIPSITSVGTTPVRQAPPANTVTPSTKKTIPANHPAPLPPQPINRTPNGGVKGLVPPKPDLKISRVSQGIVLSWTITQNLSLYSEIASYQLFAYQEGSTPPHSNLWKKVGDVKALPLPMACTLTQFQEGNKYHFAVRAIDVYQRISDFSEPSSIHLFAL